MSNIHRVVCVTSLLLAGLPLAKAQERFAETRADEIQTLLRDRFADGLGRVLI